MTTYEQLIQKTHDNKIILLHANLPVKGFYYSSKEHNFNTITINQDIISNRQRCCILAEELGHHFTTSTDLFKATKAIQNIYEYRARKWAVNELVPLNRLIDAWIDGVRTPWDLAEYLEITESFLHSALKIHSEKYGLSTNYKKYKISFNLLNIEVIA